MPVALPRPAELPLGALFSTSWATLRAHPVVSAALGGAVVLSLASMLFGIGALVTPWFICELLAVQLAILTGRPTRRSASWIRAGVLVFGLVGVVVAATWVATLVIGPDMATADRASQPLPIDEAVLRVGMIAAVTSLAVGFIAPFQYAPLILIERGGPIGAAALESAWLVRRGGLFWHWVLAFLAHLLPLAPALVAAVVVARTFERAATPLGVLAGLPLVPLSIPLGLGLLSAAYVKRRRELSERRWTRAEGNPPRALILLLVWVVLAPMLSVALLMIGTLRPAPPSAGRAPGGELVVARPVGEAPVRVHVPATTLEVRVDGRAVEVRAGDGGGTGRLATPWKHRIERVRVLRRGDLYAVELRAEDGRWFVEVDRSAIRADDSIAARLAARLPSWSIAAIAIAFALSALLLVRALEPLGTVRRAYGAPAHRRAPLETLREERRRAVRRAWTIGGVLAPGALAALAAGVLSLIG